MDTETIIRELERVEEKHKHDEVFTGQLNIATMAHDVRKRLEELKPYEDTGLTPEQIRELKERNTTKAPDDDLISRKYLLECAEYDNNGRLIIPYRYVKNAPTAFDKEKVIKELKSNMGSAQLAQSLAGTDLVQSGGFSYGYYNGVKDAVKIVEKGGLN